MYQVLNDYCNYKKLVAGIDPTPGTVKIGKIKYESSEKAFNKKIIEGEIIDLP